MILICIFNKKKLNEKDEIEVKVVILTEGGKKTGYGHLSRCSSLYDELVKRKIDVEMIINSELLTIDILQNRNYSIVDWTSFEYLRNNIQTSVHYIVDSYIASKQVCQFLSEHSKKVLYLDDTSRIKYPKGIVVRASLQATKETKDLLIGKKYIILRDAYKSIAHEKHVQKTNEILLTMGGTNQIELIQTILKKVNEIYPECKINIVLGSLEPSYFEEGLIQEYRNIVLHNYLSSHEMQKLMLASDFAITAAGQTIYELIATSTPFIPIQIADNQRENLISLRNKQLIQTILCWKDEKFSEEFDIELQQMFSIPFRKKIMERLDGLIDGLGSERIIDALFYEEATSHRLSISIRTAKESDCAFVFELSNQEYVRKYSLNSQPIKWESHVQWFKKTINSKTHLFLVVNDQFGQLVGQIRYEISSESATISISLAQSILGKGLSKTLIYQSIDCLQQKFPRVSQVCAWISDENKASIKTFERVGFKRSSLKLILKDAWQYTYEIRGKD